MTVTFLAFIFLSLPIFLGNPFIAIAYLGGLLFNPALAVPEFYYIILAVTFFTKLLSLGSQS